MIMAMRKPKTIDKNIWDSMSPMQKRDYLVKTGDIQAGKQMSRIVGRETKAKAAKSRQSEARGVARRGASYAKKLQDPMVRAELGGRAIVRHNVKKNTVYRQAGRRVMSEAGKKEIKDLRTEIASILRKLKKLK